MPYRLDMAQVIHTHAAKVVELLKERGQTLAVVESCTGGMLGAAVTSVAGSSAAFVGGFVTYSNELKQKLVGVRGETLASHGAVSAECAAEMAAAGRERTGADWCLSVTGIAGPDGGSESKPVGTVFVGLAGPAGGIDFPVDDAAKPHGLVGRAIDLQVDSARTSVPGRITTRRFQFPGSREDVRQRSVVSALAMLHFAMVREEQGGVPPTKLLWEVG